PRSLDERGSSLGIAQGARSDSVQMGDAEHAQLSRVALEASERARYGCLGQLPRPVDALSEARDGGPLDDGREPLARNLRHEQQNRVRSDVDRGDARGGICVRPGHWVSDLRSSISSTLGTT